MAVPESPSLPYLLLRICRPGNAESGPVPEGYVLAPAMEPSPEHAHQAAQYEQLANLPAEASKVVAHALDTFGSVRKALHWLGSPCGALDKQVPLDLLAAGDAVTVDEELSRIDYGIYV